MLRVIPDSTVRVRPGGGIGPVLSRQADQIRFKLREREECDLIAQILSEAART